MASVSTTACVLFGVAVLLYPPVWTLVTLCLMTTLALLTMGMANPCRGLPFVQTVFDLVWSPFSQLVNYQNILYPQIDGERRRGHGPWAVRGEIPAWARRQIYVVFTCLQYGQGGLVCLYVGLVLCYKSTFLFLEEVFCLDNFMNTQMNQGNASKSPILVRSFQNFEVSTRVAFVSLTSTTFLVGTSYCFGRMTSSAEIVLTLTFSCLCNKKIQAGAMSVIGNRYPHAVDGLGDLVVLGIFLLLDLALSSRQFFNALYSYNIIIISVTYCNAFAALMEFRIKVWLKIKYERQLVSDMRWATPDELRAHDDVCAICLGHMTLGRVTFCRHLFHGKCLRLLLKTNTQCPLCKAKLVTAVGHGHLAF
ncbi:uncharacterized protein LOC106011735 [Aplysia californica]|uniref:Uncharacterized protein LOC106011735 n=1 Tax=Aplysia californica TaxID=6500 RepID=A0ABM0ZZM2_APLCA|nr:uncharacterized protein LOC106011735 [Aplysia californica]